MPEIHLVQHSPALTPLSSRAAAPPKPPVIPATAAPQPTHKMITRFKTGIFKPRYPVCATPLLSALIASTAATEPHGFKLAAKYLH